MSTEFKQDFSECLEVMRSAGAWRETHSAYSKFWVPSLITPEIYLEEFYDDQAWVLEDEGYVVAGVTLSQPYRRKRGGWETEVGDGFGCDSALYVDSMAVRGDLIGHGIVKTLFQCIEERAKETGFDRLRLDCDEAIPKLEQTYTNNGFSIITKKDVGHRTSVFMEKVLTSAAK